MSELRKVKVGLLYGGQSGEHEVSLLSAASVLRHLNPDKYTISPIAIAKDGQWYRHDYQTLMSLNTSSLPVQHAQAQRVNAEQAIRECELIIPMMHGPLYEDGVIQGFIEMCDRPYVGAGVLASALGMDKIMAKQLAQFHGLAVVPFYVLSNTQWQQSALKVLQEIESQLTYPIFVKPARTGSSVGIQKVESTLGLTEAIEDALQYDTKLIIENGLKVREIELAVLEGLPLGSKPIVSPPGEITVSAKHPFYTYEAKYLDPESISLHVPARLTSDQAKRAVALASAVFEALDCNGMARVDLFFDMLSDTFYFNEINTVPGFTSLSLYPRMMDSAGLAYPQLLEHLINLAFARYAMMKEIKRER